MQQEQYTVKGDTYVRINKTKAKGLYNKGKTVYLLAEYMMFNGVWGGPCPISTNDSNSLADSEFNSRINDFQYYNCDAERGYGVKYFVKKKDL